MCSKPWLGASAVLVGRPLVYGLATAGAAGVAHVIRLLRDELEAAMALTGCQTLADVGPTLLFTEHPWPMQDIIANATNSYL